MKRLLSFLLLINLSFASFSQKSFFIYIQAESGQPFNVKLADKIYNSSSAGYVILPKLADSTYTFSLSFVKQPSSPQLYKVEIGRKDHGYLLKNLGDKGWGLYNMQTMVVLMPAGAGAAVPVEKSKDVSPFTEVLSKASDDPSLKTSPATKQTEKPAEKEVKAEAQPATEPKEIVVEKPKEKPVETVVVAEKPKETLPETVVVAEKPNEKYTPPVVVMEKPKENEPAVIVEKPKDKEPEPVANVEAVAADFKPSVVKKKSESSTTQGFGLVYTDTYADGHTDTIRLVIENPKTPAMVTETPAVPPVTAEAEKKELAKPESGGCAAVATETNFYELRKNMAAAGRDDAMIAEAVKYTKSTCFTTAQYKNLCVLFLNDQGRYKFFDAVYDYTADPENFPTLQSELKEEYYINRFRAMLRK